MQQTAVEEARKSEGCVTCHKGIEPMHRSAAVHIGCTDCHGGNVEARTREGSAPGEPEYEHAKSAAHVAPKNAVMFKDSGNPERSYTALNKESLEFIRFFNPGDLRVAGRACGASGCHGEIVARVKTSMMAHGAMLWGAAAYNNGAVPLKDAVFGEAYANDGTPSGLIASPAPTPEETLAFGWLPMLLPLPRYEAGQPANLFRIFERGGKRPFETGIPERDEEPGKPARRLSQRGLGTLNRTDPLLVGLQKTRLLDPTLNFLGTNDHPGDYRSSGCTACHVVYANDSSPAHSGAWARFGHRGQTATADAAFARPEMQGARGHPIKHQLTRSIPSSQCIVCHVHPGTSVVNAYYGTTWWDNETDGEILYGTDHKARYGADGRAPHETDGKVRYDTGGKALDQTEGKVTYGTDGKVRYDSGGKTLEQTEAKVLDQTDGKALHGTEDSARRESEDKTPTAQIGPDRPTLSDRLARSMRPTRSSRPARDAEAASLARNPEPAAIRGLWSSTDFLDRIEEDVNPRLTRTQLAGFAGHGWLFRNVYARDRKGSLLDAGGGVVSPDDPERFKKAVHLADIHLEKGMHCVDCHFEQDVHGTGRLHGEVRGAIEIDCADCHGTIDRRTPLTTTAAAGGSGRTLAAGLTPFGKRRFYWKGEHLFQRSMMDAAVEWEVVQVRDTVDPDSDWAKAHPESAARSRLAKTIRRDGSTWGDPPADDHELAHANSDMTCFSCHSSWVTSCFGCHLPLKANSKTPALHYEGDTTRSFVQYAFQTLRDDVFMLGRDGTVTGGRIAPVRSACAVVVSSQNANREWVYAQQPTVSAEGYSGIAFSPLVPHTVRARETKQCTDCHLARSGDNNAWMASLLMQGTGLMNFMGRNVYVGEGQDRGPGGFEAVVVTEQDEPQAVIGSDLQRLAYPDGFRDHEQGGRNLTAAVYHHGEPIGSLQLRGEYLYAACGRGGLRVYDVANIDNKGFSEKTVTAPVSPLGQRLYLPTKDAAAVAAPSTMPLDPVRSRRPENQESPIHPLYGYIYVADRKEGLIVVDVATLLDGDPTNNFLKRAATFNPRGRLNGASCLTIAGTTAFVCADEGLVALTLEDPIHPAIIGSVAAPDVRSTRAVAVQFRYAFVADRDGLAVVELGAVGAGLRTDSVSEGATDSRRKDGRITDSPTKGLIESEFPATNRTDLELRVVARVPLEEANEVYLARTYAYVAAGKKGVAVIDIEKPAAPRLVRYIDGDGAIDDARAVRIGVTNASLFAYIADGRNGLRVVQLASPEDTPEVFGFSPEPRVPKLIATYKTHGPALTLSRGLDRDRAVDESGNQLGVFGRRGARPFNAEEMARLYRRDGSVYTVTNEPPGAPLPFAVSAPAECRPVPELLPEPMPAPEQ